MRAALTAAVCSVVSCAPWGARSCTMPGALHTMLLSWFLFCVSCVASRCASAPPFSSRLLFLSLAPFAAALWACWPLLSGRVGGPTGSPRSIRFLCVVLLLRVMITLLPVSLLTCLVYTSAAAAAAWCAAWWVCRTGA